MDILIPILILSSLGLISGLGLAVASKRLAVKIDPRLEKIHGLLPGANCGACGGAGCFGFAEAVLKGELDISACRVAEEGKKEEIAAMLGKKLDRKTKLVVVLHCGGGKKVKDKFLYKGIPACSAAILVMGGQKECRYGCLGFGDCVKACPFYAISMGDGGLPDGSQAGLPHINLERCKACNKCVIACPKKLFTLTPQDATVYVACRSHDLSKDTKAVCPVGCIGCKLCEKACKFEAIRVVDNLAAIDYNKCTSCGECIKVCPTKAILEKFKKEKMM
ncbi:MAG: RnfABCDGE type electron transport complex subunit B [Candidatus Omnitrophota bacterium]|nr:RnfABCDGE type electron transport complex subunit B [Candidatus Omnitrophota bacterium]